MKFVWIHNQADRLLAFLNRHHGDIDFVHVAALVIGLMCGIGAGLLKNGIDFVTHLIFSHFDIHSVNFMFFILPIAGIFIATAYATYVTRRPMDHASERIVDAMTNGQIKLSPRLILGPIIGCSLTLGLGGSAGAEDPFTYTGAAIGSNVGRLFRLPPEKVSQMLGCGAAAAIAGIFMAPIGGVMFALEVLKMKQSLATVLAIVLASLTSSLTCYIMLGCHTDVTFVPEMRFELELIPWVIVCGVVCGAYSAYYSLVTTRGRKFFDRFRNKWVRALVGGLVLASFLALFPSLYGEGYVTLRELMVDEPRSVVSYGPFYRLAEHFDLLILLMVAVLAVKPMATSATNDSGGIGGSFTPTFFCGGVAGFLFAMVLNHFFGMHLPLAIFAFFGMAAVMSGAVLAPLMAIFIAAEMTGLYGFILPLTIAAMSSYLTTIAVRKMFAAPTSPTRGSSQASPSAIDAAAMADPE